MKPLLPTLVLVLAHLTGGLAWAQVPSSSPEPCPDVNAATTPSTADIVMLANSARLAEAECAARLLVQHVPNSGQAHFLLGHILNRRGEADESLAEYTAGARFERPGAADLAVVALDYALLKSYTDAEHWMARAVREQPQNPLFLYYLGRIEYALNHFELARLAFQDALRLEPHSARDQYNLGLSLAALGRVDPAIAAYHEAIRDQAGSKSPDAQPYFDLAALLIENARSSEARPLLEKAVHLDPKNPAIHEELSKAEEQAGQLDLATAEMESAVQLAPEVGSLHFELGRLYKKQGKMALAHDQFARSAAMLGGNSASARDSLNWSRQTFSETPLPLSLKGTN